MNEAPKDRTYSEEELAVILRRAVELQERSTAGQVPARSEGFSLREIQAIAREVGLDPDAVARAAATLTPEQRGGLARVLGGATSHELEYVADREISPDEFAQIVDVIRQATGEHGEANEVFGNLEWETAGSDLSTLHVTVRPREGRTHVKISSKQGQTALLTYVLSGGGWFILMGIAGGILEPGTAAGVLALVSGAAGGAYVTARTVWSARGRKVRDRLGALLSGLSHTLESGAGRIVDRSASDDVGTLPGV